MTVDLMKTELLEAPATVVATATELRRQLFAIYDNTTDAHLEALILAATNHVETVTWRKLISQKWRLYLGEWPDGSIMLPFGAVSEITLVRWLDGDGDDHDLVDGTDYLSAVVGPEPAVMPLDSWPSGDLFDLDSIRVEFIAGFGDASAVPAAIKHAILMLASHWYENRETVITGTTVRNVPMAFDALISPWKLRVPICQN